MMSAQHQLSSIKMDFAKGTCLAVDNGRSGIETAHVWHFAVDFSSRALFKKGQYLALLAGEQYHHQMYDGSPR